MGKLKWRAEYIGKLGNRLKWIWNDRSILEAI